MDPGASSAGAAGRAEQGARGFRFAGQIGVIGLVYGPEPRTMPESHGHDETRTHWQVTVPLPVLSTIASSYQRGALENPQIERARKCATMLEGSRVLEMPGASLGTNFKLHRHQVSRVHRHGGFLAHLSAGHCTAIERTLEGRR